MLAVYKFLLALLLVGLSASTSYLRAATSRRLSVDEQHLRRYKFEDEADVYDEAPAIDLRHNHFNEKLEPNIIKLSQS
jgi:hypothetical protein